jgi:PAS domain S-box-containing protein
MESPADPVPAFIALARHIPIVMLSPMGVVIAATEAAARLLASDSNGLVGQPWIELCTDPPERIQDYLSLCKRTLAPIPGAFSREIGGASVRFRCDGYATSLPNNSTRALLLHLRRQERQDTFLVLGQKIEELNSEILRRKKSEQQLAGARTYARAILDQMPSGVMIAEAATRRTVYSNRAAKEIFGPVAPDEPRPYPFTAFHPDGREYATEDFPLMKALKGLETRGQDITFKRPDGRGGVVRANAAPMRNEAGQIVAAVSAYYDITEQKRLEQLTERARADAESANRAKDEFLAMLGHELRNPLAPIQTALHLMQLRGIGGEKERSIIARQLEHVVRLVDDLLDISRFASGKIDLKREKIELGAVVANAIEMTTPLLEKRQQTLNVDVPSSGLMLNADSARMAQVISNLLSNAAKYSTPGSSIWIAATREAEDVVLTVRDAGIGIAPEMLSKVFDRFVQERQALDRSQGGLGLGLTIVRSLVNLHGGTVAARSDGVGHGCEFMVRLPAALPAQLAVLNGFVEEEARLLRGGSTGIRVLVVDDNEDGAEIFSETLAAMGYITRVAHDGPSALKIVEGFAPDMALLDIGLPVMDGYELAGRLREVPGLRNIHLVAVTGYGQKDASERSSRAGFDAHLVKPVQLERLQRVVRDLLARPMVAGNGQ